MKYGLLGEKLSHSYSPQIHRLIFHYSGKKGAYELFELQREELRSFLHKAKKEGYSGLNATIPYKTDVMEHLEQISDEAKKIGAVNTIDLKNGFIGYNTDYYGIGYTFLKNEVELSGKKALVTGSGGSAKAVVTYLLDQGVRTIHMASRNIEEVYKKFPGVIPVEYAQICISGPFDLIVNTTPVGMYPKNGISPLTKEQLLGAGFVFDLIYNPEKTRLMEFADEMNIPNANGLMMLVAQAVKAQEIWNNEAYGMAMADKIVDHLKSEK